MGDRTRVVGGDVITTVNGTLTLNAARGLSVGVGSARDPKSASASVSGDLILSTAGSMELRVDQALTIRAGKSTLTIAPDAITLDAPKIVLSAESVACESQGAAMAMGDVVSISGKSVMISSDDAATLELAKEAKLDGPAVKIKPGLAAETAERDKRTEEAKSLDKETITLFDRAGRRIANAPYEVSFFGYMDQGVAADGSVEVPKFPDVEQATVRWGRPKDRREDPDDPDDYEFATVVYLQVDDADTDMALRKKLHNLGYQAEDLSAAVYAYQLAAGHPPTGDVEDARGDIQNRFDNQAPVERQLSED